jgi:hypothetical protein
VVLNQDLLAVRFAVLDLVEDGHADAGGDHVELSGLRKWDSLVWVELGVEEKMGNVLDIPCQPRGRWDTWAPPSP